MTGSLTKNSRKAEGVKSIPRCTPSSGNVFADLGLPDAEDLQFKTHLILHIRELINEKKLTQSEAAALIGVDQPTLSKILNGKQMSISIDKLFGMLNKLGRSVEVKITLPKRKSEQPATRVLVA
jgi:predicted XRE-type DNA-binding protein